MNPLDFDERNKILTRPDGMSAKECGSLFVFSDGKCCISCWRVSIVDRIKILLFGKVYVSVFSGPTQPPILLTVDKWGENGVFIRRG